MIGAVLVWVGHSCPTPLILISCWSDSEHVLISLKPKGKSVGQECPTHTDLPDYLCFFQSNLRPTIHFTIR